MVKRLRHVACVLFLLSSQVWGYVYVGCGVITDKDYDTFHGCCFSFKTKKLYWDLGTRSVVACASKDLTDDGRCTKQTSLTDGEANMYEYCKKRGRAAPIFEDLK